MSSFKEVVSSNPTKNKICFSHFYSIIRVENETEVPDWADNSVRLLVARELESPERVMGVLYARLIFQPNAGKEFIVEDLLVRRDLPTEQKRNTTLALFVEFHKVCY